MNHLESIGLKLLPDFLSMDEERYIISNIQPSQKIGGAVRSSIKRYGSNVPYKNQMVSDKIPEFLVFLSEKIVEQGLLMVRPDSVSINEYHKGNAIGPHIDSVSSGPIITIVSLLSNAIMVFTKDKEIYSCLVPARSLIQLTGQLRYEWEHAIRPVESTRYSIVFRSGSN